jgi:3-phenylpropionate/cinnamic acid dioxygenase small subunit
MNAFVVYPLRTKRGKHVTNDAEAIRDLLVRYATAVDTRDWTLFRTCFTHDATTDYGEIGGWSDIEGITSFMEEAHMGFGPSNHMLSNFVIEVEEDRSSAASYVHVVLAFAHDPTSWVDSVGRYDDKLVRTTDGWRIAERRVTMTRTTTGSA